MVFALVDDDLELDRVILSDVTLVGEFTGMSQGDQSSLVSRRSPRMIQVLTRHSGFNAGRTYYLRTDSGDILTSVLKTWPVLAFKARRRAEARTVLKRLQHDLRTFYDSGPFQAFVALIIAAVGHLDRLWLRFSFPPRERLFEWFALGNLYTATINPQSFY